MESQNRLQIIGMVRVRDGGVTAEWLQMLCVGDEKVSEIRVKLVK